MNEREIFEAAIELPDAAACKEFLDQVCASDRFLRARVESLLKAYAASGSFLQVPVSDPLDLTLLDHTPEKPGGQVSSYKLLQQLGEGGMGVVYMAEQREPVQRRVALKIIKPGMDSNQVIARFEAERQALAMMDHPNIARVFDAGTTATGRPYFVMELVNGVPITQYCDENHLNARERLDLFAPVCDAIQHAHQKGVIHRDLKPGNILVASYDGRPVPKVIDFGIAKATGQQLTERTLFTALGQIVGTIEYMSPEQATRNQLDVDTRSDVYSLGVVLYELLTGETPLDRQRLRTAAWDEMLRIIREEEPPRPSVRLSSNDRLPSIAASRGTEPSKLSAIMRGELDWIVIKALEKDRSRRYDSPGQFAADIRRYLSNEAVLACPPSNLYRFRKFVRRHAYPMTFLSIILCSLILGLGGTIWQARRARISERDARIALASEREALELATAEQLRSRQSQKSAETALRTASQRLSLVYAERGLSRLDSEPHAGLPWLAEALMTDRDEPEFAASHRLRFGMMLRQVPELLGYWPATAESELTQNEQLMAIMRGREIGVFSVPDMSRKYILSHSHPIVRMVWNNAGTRIASLTKVDERQSQCQIWDIDKGTQITRSVDFTDHEFQMRELPELRFSPDGQRLVAYYAGLYNRWHSKVVVRVFDASTLEQINTTFAHHSELDFVSGYHSFSPDLNRIAVPRGTTADDKRVDWNDPHDFPEDTAFVQQYDLMTAKPVHGPLQAATDGYDFPVYSRDGKQMATSESGVVKLWNALDGTLVREFPLSKEAVHASILFHPDNQHIVLIEPELACVLDKDTGEEKTRYAHERKFFVSSTGKYCAYHDYNGNDYLAPLIAEDATSDHRILPNFSHISFAPDDSTFNLHLTNKGESGFAYQRLQRVYRTKDLAELTPPWRFSGQISHSGRFLICQDDAGTWIWDLTTKQRLIERLQLPHAGPFVDSASSRDHRLMATLTEDRWLQVINTETLQPEVRPVQIPGALSTDQTIEWETIIPDDQLTRVAIIGTTTQTEPPDTERESLVFQIWDIRAGRPLFQPIALEKDLGSSYGKGFFSRDGLAFYLPQVISPQESPSTPAKAEQHETRLRVFDSGTGVAVCDPVRFSFKLSFASLSQDGQRCLVICDPTDYWDSSASTNDVTFVQLMSTETWQPAGPKIRLNSGSVTNAKLLPDDLRIVAGNGEIWHGLTGELLIPTLVTHQSVLQIDVAPDGKSITLLAGRNNSWVDRSSEIRVISVDGQPLVKPMTSTGTFATLCARHPVQPILVEAGNRLRFWDTSRGLALSESLEFPTDTGWKSDDVEELYFSPSGDHLLIESIDGLYVLDWKAVQSRVPSDELLLSWTSLLSGARVDRSGGVIPLRSADFEAAWQSIRSMRDAPGFPHTDGTF